MRDIRLRGQLWSSLCLISVLWSASCAIAQVLIIRAPQKIGFARGTVLPAEQLIELPSGDSMDIVDLALRRASIAGPYKGRAGDLFATAQPSIDSPTFFRMAEALAGSLSARGGASRADYRHVDPLAGGIQCALSLPPEFKPMAADTVQQVTLLPPGATKPLQLIQGANSDRFEWPAKLSAVDQGTYHVSALLIQSDGLLKTANTSFTLRTPVIAGKYNANAELRALLDAGCNAQVLRWADQIPRQSRP